MSGKRLPDSLAAVVPCYNAGGRVRGVVEGLLTVSERVILVDDGSTDGCVEGLGDLPLRVVSLKPNRGKGYALQAGYEEALKDNAVLHVATVDADGQHDPSELPRLHQVCVSEESDMLIGSREFGGPDVPWRSRLGNRFTAAVTGLILGGHVPDTQSGYRIVSRRFLESVLPQMRGGAYEFEMELLGRALRGGYRVMPVPIKTIYEEGNPSSHFHKVRDSVQIYMTLLRTAWRTRKKSR